MTNGKPTDAEAEGAQTQTALQTAYKMKQVTAITHG